MIILTHCPSSVGGALKSVPWPRESAFYLLGRVTDVYSLYYVFKC